MKILALLCSLLFFSYAAGPQKITCKKISEASGLLFSKTYPNVIWTHNDSGDKPFLYAVDRKSLQLISKIKIENAQHKDWEDITYYKGDIVIGDFGNNKSRRNALKLYFIDEPNPYKEKKATVKKHLKFKYSDQIDDKIRNYDCEAMFSFNETLFLLTKHREDRNTTLYKIENDIAKKVTDFAIGGKVTSADSHGNYIAVLTYDLLYILQPTLTSDNIFDGKIYKKKIDAGKVEGVSFFKNEIKVINEDAEIFTYKIDDIIKG